MQKQAIAVESKILTRSIPLKLQLINGKFTGCSVVPNSWRRKQEICCTGLHQRKFRCPCWNASSATTYSRYSHLATRCKVDRRRWSLTVQEMFSQDLTSEFDVRKYKPCRSHRCRKQNLEGVFGSKFKPSLEFPYTLLYPVLGVESKKSSSIFFCILHWITSSELNNCGILVASAPYSKLSTGVGNACVEGSLRCAGVGNACVEGSLRCAGVGNACVEGSLRCAGVGNACVEGSLRCAGVGYACVEGSLRCAGVGYACVERSLRCVDVGNACVEGSL
ncbi:hypothetical protein HNY73_019290 [Argiope bruennichi]|uniref:Uncharacterized protein n=1 Tax=Argiope bruennichi TaxID=94029 RepID=A0A8T0EFZ4_ARGBR|nr:hypothetical protein HNY73_019290 [Argiope bruennichi]